MKFKSFLVKILSLILLLNSCKPDINSNKIQLTSYKDSVSYSLGYYLGELLKKYGIDTINISAFNYGLNQAINQSDSLLIPPQIAKKILKHYLYYQLRNQPISSSNLDWKQFLIENSKKAKIITLTSGVQYEILRQGSGKYPTLNSQITINYIGYLHTGNYIDTNFVSRPITVKLNKTLRAWQEVLIRVREGSVVRIFIPPYKMPKSFREKFGENVFIYEIKLQKVKP